MMDQPHVHSDSFLYPADLNPALFLEAAQTTDMVRRIIDRLQAFGIPVNASSRLQKYRAVLAKGVATTPNEVVAQNSALLECLQFLVITRSLDILQDPEQFRDKIRSATGGALLATDDSGGSRARSDQCELYVMAMLAHAGAQVELAEPDLVVRLSDCLPIAVAVKRPRSEAKVLRNVRAAANQISRTGFPGLVAVDLTFVQHVAKPLYVPKPSAIQVASKVLLDSYVLNRQRALFDVARRSQIIGVLLHLSCVVRSVRPHAMMVSRRWLMIGEDYNPAAVEIARALQDLGRTSSTVS